MTTGELFTYLGIFISLVAAGLGFPIPEEIPIVTAGVLAGKTPPEPMPDTTDVVGLLAASPDAGFPGAVPWGFALRSCPPWDDSIPVRWWIMLPVCIVGVVFSDALLYGMGRFFGARLLQHRFMARLMPPEKRAHIEENFHRYGIKILLFARLLPGIRAPIFITAGTMRLPLKRFLLADGIYAIPGVTLLFSLAFWFTNSFKELVDKAEAEVIKARPLVILIAVVAVAIYFVIHFYRRPISTGDPPKLPPMPHLPQMPHLPHLPHLPLMGHSQKSDGNSEQGITPPPTPSDHGPPLPPEQRKHA